MTNLLSTIRQALAKARHDQARDLDAKKTARALRVDGSAEWLYATVRTSMERDYLLSMGWEPVSAVPYAPAGGTSIWTETMLRKKNPKSATIAP